MEQKNKALLVAVYKLLARRPRTKKEILTWLTKREVPEETQEQVIQRLNELKLINDLEFACSFIRTRNLINPRSVRVLRLELWKKGVGKQDIEAALQLVEVDEKKMAKTLLEKQEWKWKKYSGQEKRQKQIEYLMRKGFPFSEVKEVLG
jgi:regulatory protein